MKFGPISSGWTECFYQTLRQDPVLYQCLLDYAACVVSYCEELKSKSLNGVLPLQLLNNVAKWPLEWVDPNGNLNAQVLNFGELNLCKDLTQAINAYRNYAFIDGQETSLRVDSPLLLEDFVEPKECLNHVFQAISIVKNLNATASAFELDQLASSTSSSTFSNYVDDEMSKRKLSPS